MRICFDAERPERMLHQPDLFSSDTSNGSANSMLDPESSPEPTPVWLHRLEFALRIFVRLYVGIFLLVLPWWARLWDDNPLFTFYPHVGQMASYGWVRGIISGLGLLNVWIALSEAFHYRESRP